MLVSATGSLGITPSGAVKPGMRRAVLAPQARAGPVPAASLASVHDAHASALAASAGQAAAGGGSAADSY
eukprot:7045090-Prymnesium_polylepis.2